MFALCRFYNVEIGYPRYRQIYLYLLPDCAIFA